MSSRIHRACIPQYTLGHRGRLARIHAAMESARRARQGVAAHLSVVGAAYTGVGVNDLVLAAHRLAVALARPAPHSPPTGLDRL